MTEPAVFLIHGLGGTQYDLGTLHKRLQNAGFVTYSITLPGHGEQPQDLIGVRAEDWLEAVRTKYREIIAAHDVVHVLGMCMGALLAIETCKREGHAKGHLVALAPPVFIDGWSTPWYRGLRHLLYRVPGLAERMRVEEDEPYGIRNDHLRAIVRAKFERGDTFAYSWIPLACVREVDRLRRFVKRDLKRIVCPTLIIHSRQDELTSLQSAHFLVERIGAGKHAGQARMVILENSYHLICVDNDKEMVAQRILEFFGASDAVVDLRHANPTMSKDEQATLFNAVCADLARGDFAALFERGTSDFVWLQPGHNRSTGVFRGAKSLQRLSEWATHDLHFNGFGPPVWNAGMALVPATLKTDAWASPGVLSLAMYRGRLLEARWFPHDADLEDARFGGTPLTDAPSAAEIAFADAARLSRTLRQAPAEVTLLQLYALYKQGDLGDVTDVRPGALDVVGRAKFDAWFACQGMARQQAMQAYVELVDKLKQAEEAQL